MFCSKLHHKSIQNPNVRLKILQVEDKCADGHPSRTTKFTKIPLPLGQSSTWQRVAKHLMPPSTTLGHVLFSSIHGD